MGILSKNKNPKIQKVKSKSSIRKPKAKRKKITLLDIFKYIPVLISNIFKEIFTLLLNVIKGIIGIFDFIISFVISFFSYIYWGVKIIFSWLWKYGLKLIFHESITMIISAYNATVYVFKIVLYDFPVLIYNKSSKYVYNTYKSMKRESSKVKSKLDTGKTFGNSIKEYLSNKYNNLSFVKEARERKEASLVILSIDQNGDDALRSESKQTYKYLARNKEGKLIRGYFAALSRLDVYSYLIDEGLTVYEIETNWSINFFHGEAASLKKKMKNKDLIFWLAQLSTYIKAGIPLTDSVKILAKQDKRKKYKSVYDSIIYELTMGESFSEALNRQGTVFPALLINMIKSAELIGDIEGTLDEMSAYYQEIEDTKKAIISAVTYPAIILVFAIGIVTFMLVVIIPKFVDVYESMNAELNPITVTTLALSSYLKTKYLSLIGTVSAIVVIYAWMYKNLKAFRSFFQYLFMHLPVVGNIIIYKEISLFSRTFATLNKNNILLTDSMDILSKITGNEIYKAIMFHTVNNLLKGEKMSESFKDHWAIPNIAYYMILTGESTGELANMLDKVGDFYQKQQKNAINMIKTFIEPILIALLAVIVGLIILSIIIPMFGIYQTIG